MNTKTESLKSNLALVFALAIAFLFAPNLWAACQGTVYFKAPVSWGADAAATVVVVYNNGTQVVPATAYDAATGYWVVNLNDTQQGTIFQFVNSAQLDYPLPQVVNISDGFDVTASGRAQGAGRTFLTCPGSGKTSYVTEDPLNEGKTYQGENPPEAKYLYFMVPEGEVEWMSALPMISTDGGVTGTVMKADPVRCGWYYVVYEPDAVPASAIFYRDDDIAREYMIGAGGTWDESRGPIPLSAYFQVLNTDILYFVPDQGAWPEYALETDPTPGFFITDPGIVGTCSYNLAAVIYDTDAALHPSFSCYSAGGEGCQVGVSALGVSQAAAVTFVNNCLAISNGLILDTLSANKKPVLNTAGKGGQCFPSPEIFNMMFDTVPGVNEMSCYDMPFSRASDGQWEFDSDHFQSPGTSTPGGFYPVENSTDATVIGTPTPAARLKRAAEGPTPYWLTTGLYNIDPVEGALKIDLYCNTAGWTGGTNCDGQTLQEMPATWSPGQADPHNWGYNCSNGDCPDGWIAGMTNPQGQMVRWQGRPEDMRNQHFCFESHATFTHKPGLNFSFRGDDDIWVFIGGKLAVDNGGTHLAAPGYVKLDLLTDKNGNALIPGEIYDIDIFFCDRRTTQSNVRIKTNMYIQQSSGVIVTGVPSTNAYEICFETKGDGSCASAALGVGSGATTRLCGTAIGKPVHYVILKRDGTVVVDSTGLRDAQVYHGGINLTDRYKPVIDKDRIGGLPPGNYRLLAYIDGESELVTTFRIAGNLNVMTRDSKSEETGRTWAFRGSAMAGVRIPVYISAFADNGASLPLDVDEESAMGQSYSLELSPGLIAYKDSTSDVRIGATETIPDGYFGGMDTVWVTRLMGEMTEYSVENHTVKVLGRDAVANLTFRLPAIAFVSEDYSTRVTPSGTEFFTGSADPADSWVNNVYKLYLVAYDPTLPENDPALGTIKICEECNFGLSPIDASPGLNFPNTTPFTNGKAEMGLVSRTPYGDPTFAEFKAVGSGNSLITATWNQLQFFKPPVPVPVVVELFDNEGEAEDLSGALDMAYVSPSGNYLDGIADSLVVIYDRLIPKDSLPDSILVFWDYKDNGILDTFRLDRSAVDAAKTEKNSEFWDSVFVFKGHRFSKDVRTSSSNPTIESWMRFKKGAIEISAGSMAYIDEKVPPVILTARITAATGGGKNDQVRLTFSEPLAELSAAQVPQATELFHYYLRSAAVNTAAQRYVAVSANSVSWNANRDEVLLVYANDNQTASPSPRAGDYVRIRAGFLTDSLGNVPTDYNAVVPSPWVQLEGDAKSEIWSIKFAEIDPNDPDTQKRIEKGEIETIYHVGLYDSPDSIKARFPGQLGYIVRTDMSNILSSDTVLMKLNPEDIQIVTETHYYTNLGGFVAEGGKRKIACDNPIFNGNATDNTTKGDCRVHPGYVFLGWNLLAHNKRLVGTGAYIAKLSTHVEIKGASKRAKHDVTEIWGVHRKQKK